jgi:hypothetical protein
MSDMFVFVSSHECIEHRSGGEQGLVQRCIRGRQADEKGLGSIVSPDVSVMSSGFRVQGSGFRVQGSGFRVQGSEFRVQK